ncbi:NADH-quinone oxidoreductase subunit NuoH [Oxalobacter sp. OttesenSCG-928-P03]|nr:NADH-quinone oxidoreductase subunit NuoH [Oxalobacter sp. OttesenSCG-928-P03]
MAEALALIHHYGQSFFGDFWFFVWTMTKLVCVLMPVLGMVAYLTLWERKMIGWMHVRLGPNRTGPLGLLQPVADGVKLLLKEIIVPAKADKKLFYLAPVLSMAPALAAWAIIPFGPEMVLANIDAGILCFMTITSIGVYGVIIAGWASNSKYAFLGAMRAAAQMISFGVPLGFILVTVLMVSGSQNLSEIVAAQNRGFFAGHGWGVLSWNWLSLLPLYVIFIVCSMAETARHPFDALEGESEIVGGHMVEYSGMAFGMFFMAEYANMILFSAMAALLFLGGWLAPVDWEILAWVPGWIWLGAKTFLVVSTWIWIRGTFPRYRYDHTMRLGWKIFLPVTLIYLVLVACWMQTPWNIWI